MLKGLLALVLFTSLSLAHAVQLRIENAFNVRAENFHQFRAILYLDNGRVFDVTRQTDFQITGYQERNNGEFYFPLPAFGDRPYQVMVRANFSGGGYWAWRHMPVQINTTPDAIELAGATIAQSGGTSQYQAFGVYGQKRVDLTNRGRWQAMLGRISEGVYTAPISQSRAPLMDQINFSFGFSSQSMNVEVRNQ